MPFPFVNITALQFTHYIRLKKQSCLNEELAECTGNDIENHNSYYKSYNKEIFEKKGNNFLICRSIKTCKAKNVVLRYKIMSKCVEGDSYLQKPTGIRRHRLRALFGGGEEGNTLEQTD